MTLGRQSEVDLHHRETAGGGTDRQLAQADDTEIRNSNHIAVYFEAGSARVLYYK
jgi:hypothetical protein